MTARIENLPIVTVAGMRHIGYNPGIANTWQLVRQWAKDNGLIQPGIQWYGISLDSPMIRPIDQCRYDATIVVNPDDKIPGDNIIKTNLPGGQHLLVYYSGTSQDIGPAIGRAMGETIPASDRQLDHKRPILERYDTDCDAGESPGSFHCDLCIPVK